MKKTLEGVKVLDMTMAVTGPFSTRMLADMGAEVTLVEPTQGSSVRTFGPHTMVLKTAGKKSVALNAKSEEGKEIMKELIKRSDVFVSNYREAGLKRLGMSYEDMKAINPAIIYATISGFGSEGPDAGNMGFDVVCYYGRSGLLTDSAPKGNVILPPYGGGDVNSAETIVMGICAALYHKAVTGEGMKVTTSLMANGIFDNYDCIVESQYGAKYPRAKDEVPRALLNSYECSDGEYITINAQHHWETSWPCICNLIGRPDMIETVTCKEEAMGEYAPPVTRALTEGFKEYTSQEVYEALLACGTIAVSKVQHSKDVATDPQAIANGMVFPVRDLDGKEIMMPSTPLRFGDNEPATYTEAVKFGADTKETLRELGYGEEKIRELIDKGIVYADGEGEKPEAVIY